MADVIIIGLPETQAALAEILKNLEDMELITRPLAELMREYVHVDSGYLQSTIDYEGSVAYASAPYASAEEERGGAHAYASGAIEAFDIEEYANVVTKPF